MGSTLVIATKKILNMKKLIRETTRLGRQVHSLIAPYLADIRWRFATHFVPIRRSHGLSGQIIVSMTSYPPRFNTLHLTLKSLFSQSIQPDKFVLWIAEQDMRLLPTSVLALQSPSFEIRETSDLRSYKKIIPALIEYSDAFIVTADDDIYYRYRWLEQLVEAQLNFPDHIVCHRVHEVRESETGDWLPYRQWAKHSKNTGSSKAFFPTSGAGAIYPPNSLAECAADEAAFLQLAPHADDIWLYWMARMQNTSIFNIGSRDRLITWRGSQSASLYAINVLDSQNDIQIAAMGERFGYPCLD